MKKDDNKEKELLEEKSAINNVVQVNFIKDEKKDDAACAVKTFDKSADKQTLLNEIDRLNRAVKEKDEEIKRLKSGFGELLNIEDKKEESIAIHKKAVDALNDAIKEAESIVSNAQKVAEKIIKNAGDSLGQIGNYCNSDYESDANGFVGFVSDSYDGQRRSVADETIEQLRQIKNSGYNAGEDDLLNEPEAENSGAFEKIKLPGADDLVISKDILAAGAGAGGPAGIDMKEIDELFENLNSEKKDDAKETGEKAEEKADDKAGQALQDNINEEKKDDAEKAVKKEKKKKGWFGRF